MATKLRATTRQKPKKGSIKPSIQRALDRGNIQEVIDNLTLRQRRFVEEYLVDFNGKAAVVRAGYGTKYPEKLAYEILAHPGIRAAMDHLTKERASKSALKPEYVFTKLKKTIEAAEEAKNHNAVLRGCEILARALGMFIERKEISGPDGGAIQLKQVQDAADAFTRSIAGLVERGGENRVLEFTRRENKG